MDKATRNTSYDPNQKTRRHAEKTGSVRYNSATVDTLSHWFQRRTINQ